MNKNFREDQRKKAVELIEKSRLFESDGAMKEFRGKKREFVLQDGNKNLHESIREDALGYFENNHVSWWGGKKPTGHVLSSQISCVNHLFALRKDKRAVMELLNGVRDEFVDVMKIESDEHEPGYIQFEAVSDNDNLNEGKSKRGTNCTSIDALIYAKHRSGEKWLVVIEWKYTESYDNTDKSEEGRKKDPINCSGEVRKRRYGGLIDESTQLKSDNHSCYYFEPFYQLMRQTLWAEQMIKNKEKEVTKADNFLHIHVVPTQNAQLLDKKYKCSGMDMISTWQNHLNDNSKYIVVSPELLLNNVLTNHGYDELRDYLRERYWG